MKKKFLLVLMVTVLSILTLSAVSASAESIASGECGDNLTWNLDSDGTLTISGSGEMWDYSYYSDVPWYNNRKSITQLVIGDSVSSIGYYAF